MSRRRKTPVRRTAPAPAAAALMKHGWCRRDAEHLLVVELALSQVQSIGTAAGAVLAEHAATALAWEPVICGVRGLYTEPEHAAPWRALAGYCEGPMRTLMLGLAAEADGCDVVNCDEQTFTAEDLRVASCAVEAQNRGDFAEALRLLSTCRRPLDDTWVRDLERVVAYGEQMSPAQWGRWLCTSALRWCQGTERGLDMGVHYASVALRALGASDDVLEKHAPRRAVYDQVVHDALLWDEGGLEQYVERDLAPALAARAPGFAGWSSAPLVAVSLLGATPSGDAECEDVLDGRLFVVGDEHLAEQHPPGRIFVGRLVQVEGDDRWYFAMLPTVCDEVDVALELAHAVADGADADMRIDLQHRWMRRAPAQPS
jgi:hypothetical protein